MSNQILQVSNLTKSFKDTKILDSLSFYLNKGEIVGFLGSNGAGKSTTLRCLLGIYSYDGGEIKFNLDNKSTQIGYLPEERGMYKDVKVIDMLLYFSRLKNYSDKKAKIQIKKYLKKFGLEGKEKLKVEELSKGMGQKVQFIGSIIHEPEILILDEPLSGLDPVSQDIFKQEIISLSKKGTTIFFSSHQIDLVEELCHRVYLLNKGKFVLDGEIGEIKKNYGGYLIYLNAKSIPKEIKEISHSIENLQENQHKIYLNPEITKEKILNIFLKNKFEEISIKRISLHEIYIREVKKEEIQK